MGREQIVHARARQRVDDEEMRRGRIALGIHIGDLLGTAGDLLQRRGERQRPFADLGTLAVSLVFARPADRHLHQAGGERPENEQGERAEHADIVVVVAPATEEHAEIGQHGDGAGDGSGDGHQQRVVVLDMAELVREHAGKLLLVHGAKQAGGDGDGGILRITPGGKRVRLRVVHDIDPRHRQPGRCRKLAHQCVQLGRRAFVDRARAVHRQHHLVRVPIGEQVHRRGHDERHDHASLAGDQKADPHEQGGQHCEQDGGAQIAHLSPPRSRDAEPMAPWLRALNMEASDRATRWRQRLDGVRPHKRKNKCDVTSVSGSDRWRSRAATSLSRMLRSMKSPSISFSRTLLMKSLRIGRPLWPGG